MAAVVEAVLGRWFTPAFAGMPQAQIVREQVLATNPLGYARACEAIRDMDLRGQIGAIVSPTLIVAGADDPATPPQLSETLRTGISGAELIVVPRAAHLLNIEQAERVNRYLEGFFGFTEDTGFIRGPATRRGLVRKELES